MVKAIFKGSGKRRVCIRNKCYDLEPGDVIEVEDELKNHLPPHLFDVIDEEVIDELLSLLHEIANPFSVGYPHDLKLRLWLILRGISLGDTRAYRRLKEKIERARR